VLFQDGVNIAVDCGKSNLIVFDLDVKNGRDGLANWEALKDELGLDDSEAWVSETPSGGQHIIFSDTTSGSAGNSARNLPSGIDVRGNGGYIIVPPSTIPEGNYRWLHNLGQPGPLPTGLAELLLRKLQEKSLPALPPIGEERHTHSYALAGLRNEAEILAKTAQGGRNEQLNTSAFKVGQLVATGTLNQNDAEVALYNACVSNGLVNDDGERSVMATLESGLEAGMRQPRSIPERQLDVQREKQKSIEVKKPATWPYDVNGGRITYMKYVGRGDNEEIVSVPVADFTAHITHQITTEYGDRHYRLSGKPVVGGGFTTEIRADDFAETQKLVSVLDGAAGALDPVRTGMRQHLGPAIKLLSRREKIENWRRFERVGWDGRHYLIPGRLGINVECKTDRCLPFSCPHDADLDKGMEALEYLLMAFAPETTAPVIGFALLPPIARVAGLHNERFGLFIVGRTGVLKTSYIQTVLACYGNGFLDDNTLLKWGEGATRNAIMALATQATDAPLLIDNYKPGVGGGNEHFVALWHNIIEGGEKRRLSRAAELKETRPIWAWPIATGEAVPSEDASTLARMLAIQFEWARGQNNAELARAQLLAEHLPAVLGTLLDWLEGDGWELVREHGKALSDLRQIYALKMLDTEAEAINTRRMGSSLAVLDIGWSVLEAHPILGSMFQRFTPAFHQGLEKIAAWQAGRSLEALEARQFLDGLCKLLDSGRLWLTKNRELGTREAQNERRGFVGWRTIEESAYVLPDAITLVKSLMGTHLNGVSDRTIYNQLAEIGALAGSDVGRNTKLIRIGTDGSERPRTLWLTAGALGNSD